LRPAEPVPSNVERNDRLSYFQQVSKANYDATHIRLKVSVAKTWWARYDCEGYFHGKRYQITNAVPARVTEDLAHHRLEFEHLADIAKISQCFRKESGSIVPPHTFFLAKKMYLSETLNRVRGTISSVGPIFTFVRVLFEGQDTNEYMQVRAIFRCEFDDDSFDGIYILGRWCERLGKDRTQQELLKWEEPPARSKFAEGRHFQFISVDTVLESVTAVAKPRPAGDGGEDTFCIDDNDRRMWIHQYGRSALGEV
jgi:hypothetical protein